MKNQIFPIILLFAFISAPSFSQHDHEMGNKAPKSDAVLIPGLGNYHREVTTKNPEAQKFFNQGLTLIYGFNHDEAIRSFQKAAELDPHLAMAYWGIAFALGPNYNLPADNEQRKLAYEAMSKARKLSKYASPVEKDFIDALSKRYVKNVTKVEQPVLDKQFKDAMKQLHLKYPDDPDAATFYAESLMDLKPWQLWNKDGTPAEGTEEIVSVLETVLKKYPDHPGANHYYIHAVEASNDPGRGLESAKKLESLVPYAGHLVHMPAHILFRVGDYEGSSKANIVAMNTDEDYISKHKPKGVYPFMYYNHNVNFLSVSRMMQGMYADARKYARQIEKNVKPMLGQMPMAEAIYANPLMIDFSFQKWDEVLNYPPADSQYHLYNALLHFSRGVAFASKGDADNALKEQTEFRKLIAMVPNDYTFGLNPASLVFGLCDNFLDGKIAFAKGDKRAAIDFMRKAALAEDQINYDEPPDWYPSVRLTLGNYLYADGDYAGAETAFRENLKQYPHNGRGLLGLAESLKAQGKDEDAAKSFEEYKDAWSKADVQLDISAY